MVDFFRGTYGGGELLFARTLNSELLKAGVQPPDAPNSFECPLGPEPGRGELYMARDAVEQIRGTELMFGLGFTQLKFPQVHLVRAQRIRVPGTASQNSNSPYLVEVADRRWPLSKKLANLRYNMALPKSSGYGYIKNTLQDGDSTPWTWAQVIMDLWGRCNIGDFNWPNPTPTPTSTPANITYEGVSLLHALCDAAKRIGLALRYDCIADTFSLIQMGSGAADAYSQQQFTFANQGGTGAQIGIQSGQTQRTQNDWLIADSEMILGVNFLPANITVAFENSFGDRAQYLAYGRNFYVTIPVNSLGLGSRYVVQSDSYEELLHDSLPAKYDITGINFMIPGPGVMPPTPTNLSDLQARATERARAYVRSIVDDCDAKIKKAGLWKILPGPTITSVEWSDVGDANGCCTTLKREPLPQSVDEFPRHEHVRQRINCTLTQDLVRGGSATATVNDITPLMEMVTIYDDLPIITTNTVYKLTLGAGSGTFTLTVNNQTTGNIGQTVALDDLENIIGLLSSVNGVGNVSCTGGMTNTQNSARTDIFIEFTGTLAETTVTLSAQGSEDLQVTATVITKGNTLASGMEVYGEWYEALLHYQIDGWPC